MIITHIECVLACGASDCKFTVNVCNSTSVGAYNSYGSSYNRFIVLIGQNRTGDFRLCHCHSHKEEKAGKKHFDSFFHKISLFFKLTL